MGTASNNANKRARSKLFRYMNADRLHGWAV